MTKNHLLKEKLALLPDKPGCYMMKDARGQIIYVGKAKSLKNRVRSYFTGSHDTKTQRLVGEIEDFEVIVTSSPMESLLLELNLIKKHTPRYNVMLKDDKTYPYIKLTADEHPRLEITRKVKKDKAKYFGPYPDVGAARETKRLLDRLYPLRKCKHLKDQVCLYYHIHQCLAPCVYPVEPGTYEKMTKEIIRFLNGGDQEIRQELEKQMYEAAEQLQFERAKELRDLIRQMDHVLEKQKITLQDREDRDVFGYAVDRGFMCVQVLFMRQGKLIEREGSVFPYYGEPEEDFLSFVGQFYYDFEPSSLPKEILLPEVKEGKELSEWLDSRILIPKRGVKRDLVKMASENAAVVLKEKLALMDKDEKRRMTAVERLGKAIGIDPPTRIEAFDNSNIQGADPVSAMVVFTEGNPDKKEYRKYRIKTVKGPDDYETMREVIRRRYTRVLKENLPLPDLILIDGGKGQLASALEVLEDELGLSIPVCGMVKDDRHQTSELIMGNPPQVVPLEKNSPEFYLVQRIQEEVHRFAITFHRQTRTKGTLTSELDRIPGIGPKRRRLLLNHFGSVKRIREASLEELRTARLGERLAQTIYEYFHPEEELNNDKEKMEDEVRKKR